MTAVAAKPKIVLLGMMTKHPVGGVVWQVAQYLTGFARLGFDVYYVEAHGLNPSMLMRDEHDDASARAAEFIDAHMRRFDLHDHWALHALHDDGRCYGMSETQLYRLYAEAAVIINLHGGTVPRPEHSATGRLVYLGTDPVQVELEVHEGRQETLDYLEPHCAFFTYGLNYGESDCLLPYSERFPMVPTVQPVVIDQWYDAGLAPGDRFTTIGNWRQHLRDVEYGGQTYTWSKHHEFAKFLDLPTRAGQRLELALASIGDDDRKLLEQHGWAVRAAAEISRDPDSYRDYVRASRGEFSVAKDQNVRLRTGWFSDRSASYLAAGRPVVVQDTGIGATIPVGAGLFAVSDVEEAAAALKEVASRYHVHSQAAVELARSYFDSDVVLGAMLRHLDVSVPRRRPRRFGAVDLPVPSHLVLEPTQRRPMQLPAATVETVLSQPVPQGPAHLAPPAVSVVMVTFGQLLYTRMAVEALLAVTSPGYELIVVDNDSRDGTPEYLAAVAARNAHVSVVLNDSNAGFAAANNQGLREARGSVIVLLNNDTIVTRGWLQGLLAHLDDDSVGLVGAVTNRIANEAQIETTYRDYGGLARFARSCRVDQAGKSFDIPVVTMFCAAMRRSTYEAVGPLDENFGIGMFEDDDYAVRVREAGLRVVVAEDVFVHHFGEATLGLLAPQGRYGEVSHRNRRRFEEKWQRPRHPHARRPDDGYETTRRRILEAVAACTPPASVVAVVSRGDDELLRFAGREGRHFPARSDGTYIGHHPTNDHEALSYLRDSVLAGATHLLLPKFSWWWLEYYVSFEEFLGDQCEVIVHNEDCIVFKCDGGLASPTIGQDGSAQNKRLENLVEIEGRSTPCQPACGEES